MKRLRSASRDESAKLQHDELTQLAQTMLSGQRQKLGEVNLPRGPRPFI